MCLQVWYDYARWQADSGGGVAQATACLQRAVHALPNCLLLFFALADLHEAQGDVAAAKQVRGLRTWSGTDKQQLVHPAWFCLQQACVVLHAAVSPTEWEMAKSMYHRSPPAPHLLARQAITKPCVSHSVTKHSQISHIPSYTVHLLLIWVPREPGRSCAACKFSCAAAACSAQAKSKLLC